MKRAMAPQDLAHNRTSNTLTWEIHSQMDCLIAL